jgi:hypothetical protein
MQLDITMRKIQKVMSLQSSMLGASIARRSEPFSQLEACKLARIHIFQTNPRLRKG